MQKPKATRPTPAWVAAGVQGRVLARTHGGECKGKNEKGMRWRAQAGWGPTRVRPAGLAEDRVQQTASAPAGP